jgi:hypothetical protein
MISRIWLTYKQHRFETIAVTVLCLGAAVGAIVEAWRISSVGFPPSCLVDGRVPSWFDPSAGVTACQLASQRFRDVANGTDVSLVRQAGQLLPFLAGVAIGAPLVAGEIEQGTAPLSWSLSGSRRKWLLARMLAAVVLLVPLLIVLGLASDVQQAAAFPGVDAHASFYDHTSRGVAIVFWGLAALFVTIALGTFLGRTFPAVFLGLFVLLLARGLWEVALDATVLRPLAVLELPGVSTPGEYVVYSGDLYLDGKPWQGDVNAWWQAHTTCTVTDTATVCSSGDSNPGPQPANFVIHGDQYWAVVARECAIMLLGSLCCGAIALFWVGRRRPY